MEASDENTDGASRSRSRRISRSAYHVSSHAVIHGLFDFRIREVSIVPSFFDGALRAASSRTSSRMVALPARIGRAMKVSRLRGAVPTAKRSTAGRARPRGRDRSRLGEACGHGSNAAALEVDGGERESLLAERSEVGNNLGTGVGCAPRGPKPRIPYNPYSGRYHGGGKQGEQRSSNAGDLP